MFRTATLFSVCSWLPVIASGLLPDSPAQTEKHVVWLMVVLMLLALIWHFTEARHWRVFSRPQRVTWCLWSTVVLGLLAALLIPAF